VRSTRLGGDDDEQDGRDLQKRERDSIAEEHLRSKRRTARRHAQQRSKEKADKLRAVRAAARAVTATLGANPVRPTDEELADYEHNATSAQQLFAEQSGFDVCGQAFDERPTFAAIDDEVIAERMDAYRSAMGPTIPIAACACCGVLVIGEECATAVLDSLSPLRLNDVQRLQYEGLASDARRLRNVVEYDGYLYYESLLRANEAD
jgi:hypothetical protein